MNKKKQGTIIVAVLCVVALLLVGVFVIGWHVGKSEPASDIENMQAARTVISTTVTTEQTTPAPTIVAPIAVKFEEPFEPYVGRLIEVEGNVSAFIGGDYGIHLKEKDYGYAIICHFSDLGEAAKVAELHVYDRVIVTGICGEDSKLYGCTIRLADGNEITPTPLPPIRDGICELTVEEYLALDLARNDIRGEVLFQGGNVQITGKIVEKGWAFIGIVIRVYSYSFDIEDSDFTLSCWVDSSVYAHFNEGDLVTVTGKASRTNSTFLSCDEIFLAS